MRGRKLIPKAIKILDISKEGSFFTQETESNQIRFMTSPILNNIESLKLTASDHGFVSLSPHCVGMPLYSVFTIYESPKDNVWKSEEYKGGKYVEYVNPEIVEYSKVVIG